MTIVKATEARANLYSLNRKNGAGEQLTLI